MVLDHLIPFVQDQYRRIDRWAWETIVEEVALHQNFGLDADHVTYASGALRTGPLIFRRNDEKWRTFCKTVIEDDKEAINILHEITRVLASDHRHGVGEAWFDRARNAIERDASDFAQHADALLEWDGLIYRSDDDFSDALMTQHGIVYGLWRLDENEQPYLQLPHYVGEAVGNMLSRIVRPPNKCHRDWWGDGKAIGVTLCAVDPSLRKSIEKHVIQLLVPFCNVSGSRLQTVWPFPQP